MPERRARPTRQRRGCMVLRSRGFVCVAVTALVIARGGAGASAQEESGPPIGVMARAVRVELRNGDILSGVLAPGPAEGEGGSDVLHLRHAMLGEVKLAWSQVRTFAVLEPEAEGIGEEAQQGEGEGAVPTSAGRGAEQAAAAEQTAPEGDRPPIPAARGSWDSQFELGLSGSSGNSERTTLRLSINGKWSSERQRFTFDSIYLLNTDSGEVTQNRFAAGARNEWLIVHRPLSFFVQGGVEYDEFKDYDYRVTAGAGLGYEFMQTERTTLRGRLGAGASREVGGPDDDVVQELIAGAELEHRLTDRQRVLASAEYYPSLEDAGDYRAVLNAAWELKIDGEQDISLRVGMQDRYDSTTVEAKNNDIEYFVSLVLGF